MLSQERAPLFEALVRHIAGNPAQLHVPGHGQGRVLPEDFRRLGKGGLFALDLTELPGLDDLHNPVGPLARAQELAAALYGADRSFFLVNGSTVGIGALLLAAVGQGEVILPRNAHSSFLGGLVLSGADPVFVYPETIPGFGLDCGVAPAAIEQALVKHPAAAAVFALHPNYYGVAGDLAGQARSARRAGKPLLVDEAHGAHLRFHPDLPADAMSEGAAASVQSTHKLGGSLTQTSLLHLKGGLVDAGAVAAALRLLETTSPSYILLASLDLARQQLALKGRELLERALELARGLRRRLARIRGLRLLGPEDLPQGNYSLDPTKLVISVRGLGLTGFQVRDLLAHRYRVYVEMADACHVVAFVTIGTAERDCRMLGDALADLAVREKGLPGSPLPELPGTCKKLMKPREAWFSSTRRVALAEAAGRICAETVAVYPPGIPAVYPGEEITPEIVNYLTTIRDLKLPCQGPSDSTLKTLKVVIE